MPFLIYQLKLAAAFLLLYIFFRLFLAREPLHSFNRIAVLLSIVIAAVLPACVITFHVEAAPLTAAVFSAGPVEPSSDGPGFDWVSLLLAVYIVGAAAVLLSGIASVISLMRLISRGERLRQSDGTVVVLVDEPVAPMSWMKFIILSREDYSSDPEAIMVHEKAHIRLGHSVDVLLADLFTALQWFNPAAWMMRDDLRAIHEYQADEEVVKSGIDVKQYQLLLVKKAFGANGRSVSNNFNHGELKKKNYHDVNEKVIRLQGVEVPLCASPRMRRARGKCASGVRSRQMRVLCMESLRKWSRATRSTATSAWRWPEIRPAWPISFRTM